MQIAMANKKIMQELINKNKDKLRQFYNLDVDSLFDKTLVETS